MKYPVRHSIHYPMLIIPKTFIIITIYQINQVKKDMIYLNKDKVDIIMRSLLLK